MTTSRPSDEADQAHGSLGADQQPALGQPVGEQPGERGQQQHRRELQAGGDADGDRGVVGEDGEDQPVLGDALHPGADVRHDGAGGPDAGS